MIDEKKLHEAIDRSDITGLVAKSILTRDNGLWKEHAETFHSQAEFTSSWWQGSAAEFIQVAKDKLEAVHREGGDQKHVSSNVPLRSATWSSSSGARSRASSLTSQPGAVAST